MNELRLPNDLVQFLLDRRELRYDSSQCEAGKVLLHKLEELRLSPVHVDSDQSSFHDEDPNKGKRGYYVIPSVSLLKECEEDYDPEGILCWIPDENQFGTWDLDHYDLFLFGKEITWKEIVANPLPFLNYQWHEEHRNYFRPFAYPFHAD